MLYNTLIYPYLQYCNIASLHGPHNNRYTFNISLFFKKRHYVLYQNHAGMLTPHHYLEILVRSNLLISINCKQVFLCTEPSITNYHHYLPVILYQILTSTTILLGNVIIYITLALELTYVNIV